MLIDFDTAARRLFGAIILQALIDAVQNRQPHVQRRALAWLQSAECRHYLELVGHGRANLAEVLASGRIQACLRRKGAPGYSRHGRPARRTGNRRCPGRPR